METDSGQRAMMRRREGARGRRERRLRAEARIRLQLCRDALRVASHRGGEGYKAREGEVREPHYGLRAPATRPAPLLEVLPQVGVPKFFVERIPPRTSVREPQLAEQLEEVPTIISYSSVREIVEQNVDIPVPHGRDGGEGLLGLHPGQSSTAFSGADHRSVTAEQIVDIPAPRGGRVLHPASSSSGLPGTANQGFFSHFSPG